LPSSSTQVRKKGGGKKVFIYSRGEESSAARRKEKGKNAQSDGNPRGRESASSIILTNTEKKKGWRVS